MTPDASRVSIARQEYAQYSKCPPYNPSVSYPEYSFGSERDPTNHVYGTVRDSLLQLGMDSHNSGTSKWNPLSEIVNPGETVVIKPNMIAHQPANSGAWECLITHGSVLRPVVDYVYLALRGRGRIIIADAPQEDSLIDIIKDRLGIAQIQDLYARSKNFEIEFFDLRDKHLVSKDGVYVQTVQLAGDPLGNAHANLGANSHFSEVDGQGKRYYGAFYDLEETNHHHRDGVHEYMISRTALCADVFISVPKMKTHKKVGVTLNLKGLVGINGQKNWLPHYAIGSPEGKGDQFQTLGALSRLENGLVLRVKALLLERNRLASFAARKLKRLAYLIFGDTEQVIRSGNWYGNDTCWRMTLDLNRILLYADSDGKLTQHRKRFFSIVDGIIGMDGNGPVAGSPKPMGLILAGMDPVAVDTVAATVMGFDYRKINLLSRAWERERYPLAICAPDDVSVYSSGTTRAKCLSELMGMSWPAFAPHFGWKGHIELTKVVNDPVACRIGD